jgi:prolipoprotein diacylglyceryl transferase
VAVPAGIIGGRIYFDITTPFDMPHQWWGPFAVWDGGLGIWGGVALAALVGAWRVRRAGASVGVFMNAVAPALLVAQAIGRIGNYFNQELFGKPSSLPWAVEISRAARLTSGMPAADMRFSTFQPSFLYELIFDLALAAGGGVQPQPHPGRFQVRAGPVGQIAPVGDLAGDVVGDAADGEVRVGIGGHHRDVHARVQFPGAQRGADTGVAATNHDQVHGKLPRVVVTGAGARRPRRRWPQARPARPGPAGGGEQ